MIALALLLVSTPPWPVELGADRAALERALGGRRAEWLSSRDPQALSRALLASGLLAELNALGVTPKTKEGALDPERWHQWALVREASRELVFGFGRGGTVGWIWIREHVPTDPAAPRGSKERLAPIEAALERAQVRRMEAKERDRYGNVFAWQGKAGGGIAVVRYLPAHDRITVLIQAEPPR
jgi:hypothetical protein